MSSGKKFHYRISQTDSGWRAELTRRATARKTIVSKAQDGFVSSASARTWAEAELKTLLANVRARRESQ